MPEAEVTSLQKDLFKGEHVRLAVDDPQVLAEAYSRWMRDSEFSRLSDADPARMYSGKAVKEWIEKQLEEHQHDGFSFSIRTTADDRLIGDVELDGVSWSHGETFVGIGIGEREFWGKGYGTEAMNLVLRFAFIELNLQRVSLNEFSYNPRGIRSYEKVGFVHEGRQRQVLRRDGQRYDLVFMGILREEWLSRNRA